MKAIKGLQFVLIAVLLAAIGFVTPAADAQTTDLPTIHALVIAMDNDPELIGRYEKDRNRVRGLLTSIWEKKVCLVELTVLQRSNDRRDWPTRPNILNWIKDVQPASNDVIFVYFCGHGSKDESQKMNDGTFLQVSGAKLYREEVVKALSENPLFCRLKILVTDSCSGNGRGEGKLGTSNEEEIERPSEEVYRDLFVKHQGFLHLASASPRQLAFGDNINGGWFTDALVGAIKSDEYARGKTVGWQTVFDEASKEVAKQVKKLAESPPPDRRFKYIKIQQTPKKYASPRLVTDPDKWITRPGRRGSIAGMVRISAGKFRMGTNRIAGHSEAQPIHEVYLDAFYIDKHEVTVGEYYEFLLDTGHRSLPEMVSEISRTDRHPVVGVSWHDAMAYARWAGKRLPTEAEWEKAARGGLKDKDYPWGNEPLTSNHANYYNRVGTAPVGSYEPNNFGLYDMAGNVSEWCLDPWDADFYKISPEANPFAGPMLHETVRNFERVKGFRVRRGGSFLKKIDEEGVVRIGSAACFVGQRRYSDSTEQRKNVGFRCVMDVSD